METLSSRAKQLNQSITSEQADKLGQFMADLDSYNRHTNLVSNSDPDVVVLDHILDSLSLVSVVSSVIAEDEKLPRQLIDIGSGAGFPGLILAIMLPDLQVLLVDSVEKKTNFLMQEVTALKLKGTRVLCDRVEELAHQSRYRGAFGVVTARAVAASDVLCELSLPLLKVGGVLLMQKSASQIDDETQKLKVCLPLLGGEHLRTTHFSEEIFGKQRSLLEVRKTKGTSDKYPRVWKKIKEAPLGQLV